MKFCTDCGKPNPEEAEFCTNCGKSFRAEDQLQSSPPPNRTNPVANQKPRKPMKKRSKVMWIISGILVIALISTHLILSSIYDPMKKIDAMNTAYNSQDKEAFLQEFNVKKGTVAGADNFYSLVSRYGWSELRNQLTYEVEKIKNKEPADLIYQIGEFISITKKPVVLGLYQDVNFTILPTTVSIESRLDDTTFHFGGKEVVLKREEDVVVLGQFIPGEYEWSYESTGEFMPLTGKGTYVVEPSETNEREIDIDWNLTSIYLDSDIVDAIVYIDGKSTKKSVTELRELFPAQFNKDVKIHAVSEDEEGNEIASSEVVFDREDLYLPFEHIQKEQQSAEVQEEVKQLYKDFRSDYANAIYQIDFSYIEDYFKSGSKIRKDYAKFVSDHSTIAGYTYEFLVNDITAVKELENGSFELLSFEQFNYSSYDDDSLRYDRKKKYVISNVNGEYFIDSITDLETKKTKY